VSVYPGQQTVPDTQIAADEELRQWQMPPLDDERGILTGVAAGIAREIGISPIHVRIALLVLTAAGGAGLVVYVVAWPLMRLRVSSGEHYEPVPKGRSPRSRHLGFASVMVGVLMLLASYAPGFEPALVWPAALIGAAIALAFDHGYLEQATLGAPTVQVRLAIGAILLVSGIVAAIALNFTVWQAVRTVAIAGLIAGGLALLFAPLVTRTAEELLSERRRRIRSEERADISAHLHDSVLQTLALIQKRSDDTGVKNLARRQERELRTWLFEEKSGKESLGFRAALQAEMAQVEDLHGVPVEVIVVGDHPSDPASAAILAATREAATNAARHSKSPRIDVYAEVQAEQLEIFVRDQGTGFDPDTVPEDRVGIRDSIRARIERQGGDVTISSRIGQGTEVELCVPLERSRLMSDDSKETDRV